MPSGHKPKILHLHVKSEYFDQIKSGEKIYEYREVKEYWKKRLLYREYDEIHIKNGYPKRNDMKNTIRRPWNGFVVKPIIHKEFGEKPVPVFCIKVN